MVSDKQKIHLEKLNQKQKGLPHLNQRERVCGVGINDVEESVANNGIITKAYNRWRSIIQRCYDLRIINRTPNYIGCMVDGRWLFFSNFLQWFAENYVEGYDLDKDILVKGNKVYSPDTCCFVPHLINSMFTKTDAKRGPYPIGVRITYGKYQARLLRYDKSVHLGIFDTPEEAFYAYKDAKEAYIKEVATTYYNEGKITKRVYDALMKYQVEITD